MPFNTVPWPNPGGTCHSCENCRRPGRHWDTLFAQRGRRAQQGDDACSRRSDSPAGAVMCRATCLLDLIGLRDVQRRYTKRVDVCNLPFDVHKCRLLYRRTRRSAVALRQQPPDAALLPVMWQNTIAALQSTTGEQLLPVTSSPLHSSLRAIMPCWSGRQLRLPQDHTCYLCVAICHTSIGPAGTDGSVAAATAARATVCTLNGGTNAAPATGILARDSVGSALSTDSRGLPTADSGIFALPHLRVP